MQLKKKVLYLHPHLRDSYYQSFKMQILRPIRLSVRTPDFHSGKRSSTLLWATKQNTITEISNTLWQIINQQKKESDSQRQGV